MEGLMQNHLNIQQIDGYREESLSIHERRQVENHIFDCDECRERLCEALNVNQGIAYLLAYLLNEDLEEEDNHLDCEEKGMIVHPTSAQLRLYLGLRLPPDKLKQINWHLAECDVCKQKYRKITDIPVRDTSLERYASDPAEEDLNQST